VQLIRDLHHATNADGEDQAQKGTQLLEIYALEIQMYNETKNYKKLKARLAFQLQLNVLTSGIGNLQRRQLCAISNPTSPHPGCHQGVWWQDVDGRA
jgi:hypothetical protein